MSDGELRGGDWALVGFYYQMAALQGLATLEYEPLRSADADTRHLVTSFTTNKDVQFRFEDAGQDVSIAAGDKRLLCQMKHSDAPVENTIDLTELRKILKGFAHSLEYADRQGGAEVCGCILITNRLPHDVITYIKAVIQQCRTVLGWQANQVNALPKSSQPYANVSVAFNVGKISFSGTIRDLVKQWLTEPGVQGKKKKQPAAKDIECALRVLPGMYIVTEARFNNFKQKFVEFARRYGAQDEEIKNAKNELLGRLISENNLKQPLTHRDFVHAITKHGEARELTPAGMSEQCVIEWDRWCKGRNARLDWIVNRSDIQADFERALLNGKRIIFLVGEGGCGKTELLTQLVQAQIDMLRSGSSFDGFVALESCPEVKLGWLERALGKWANRGIIPEQRLDSPYTRLTIANPSVKHILLWINLDGLDEHFPSEYVLKEMVDAVRERPNKDICLLMTSRGREYKDVEHYINRGSRFPSSGVLEPDVEVIPVKELQNSEVQDVVLKGTGIRIEDYPSWSQVAPHNLMSFSTMSRGLLRVEVKDDFLESLKHPRLLGAFVHTQQQNNGVAQAALDGNTDARNKIANTFLWQFLNKYKDRREAKDLPRQENFACLLQEIVKDIYDTQDATTKKRWVRVADDTRIVDRHKAGLLFGEAASGGLISIVDETANDPEWKWKHPFVAVYLSTAKVEDYCPK